MKLSDVRIKDKKDMQMSFVNITERFSGKSRFSKIHYRGILLFTSRFLFSVLTPKAFKAISQASLTFASVSLNTGSPPLHQSIT